MDKYPVFREEQTVGELTVTPEALYTAFSVSCRGREGLWCAWAVGETGNLRIGVLEPENGCLQIRRRFSKRLTDPLGPILRGELRPFRRGAGAMGAAETGTAEKSIPPLPLGRAFRCADLPAGAGPSHRRPTG